MAEWLMVIITAVYVVATIVICYYNGKSAKEAQKQTETAKQQIEEMIKQYNDSNRPIVTIRFDIIRSGLLCFVLENVGPVTATEVQVIINDEFIDNIKNQDDKNELREITKARMLLASHQREYIFLGARPDFINIANAVAIIDITYSGKYSEHIEIDIWQYRFLLSYCSELEDISQHLKHIEEEEKSYHRKLFDSLSNRYPVNVLVHNCDESLKFEVYKVVCLNSGISAEGIAEMVEISKENVLNILLELEQVDRFVKSGMPEDDVYRVKWYRR